MDILVHDFSGSVAPIIAAISWFRTDRRFRSCVGWKLRYYGQRGFRWRAIYPAYLSPYLVSGGQCRVADVEGV